MQAVMQVVALDRKWLFISLEQGVIDFNNNHLVDALTWYAPVLMVAVAWVTLVRQARSARLAGGIEGEGLDALNG